MPVLQSSLPSHGNASAAPAVAAKTSRRRLWAFRAAAVVLGIAVFALVELLCVVFNLGREPDDDPFVGFSSIHPLFVRGEGEPNYRIAKSRLPFFAPDEFPAVKGERTFRVFCFGGSTVQGNPFSKETSFTTWLELGLNAAAPERDWEVVNCGGISYATYRLVPILKECLAYEPDLFVICAGHNEFLEERTYEKIKHAPAAWKAVAEPLSRLRTVTVLRHAAASLRGEDDDSARRRRFVMKAETDPLLDYYDGLKAYHRDDEWRRGVIEHYALNIRRMIALSREAGVPVLLIRPTSNLCDCPPFKSEHRQGLSDRERAEWKSLVERAQSHFRDDLPWSIELLEQAIALDDQYAATHYELGKCFETLGMFDRAREELLLARELDICPLRMLTPMEEALAEIARETATPYLDAHDLLERLTPSGILGDSQLADHVHPTIPAHQKITGAIMEEMQRQGWVALGDDWQQQCRTVWQKHFESLPNLYFLKGKQHLENLRLWAQGRADGPPIETRLDDPLDGEDR